ncbi:MAG: hypothetical protein M1826_003190 [Phylliscum demangeonii]|nr:MAG: hypothetical protein M1826_003190 [Phylliscum demangeonii]
MFPHQDLHGQHPHPSAYDDRTSTGPHPPSIPSASALYPSARREYSQEGLDPRLSTSMAHMASMPPPPVDMYRMPPHDGYLAASDPYRTGAGTASQPHLTFTQPAPRQRTAIACRYCRRRKIRCSGFESSEDGRCTNCQRFNQECIFTPVSSQAQAFVPAHTAYPHLRTSGVVPTRGGRAVYPPNAPVIYGAHGQPLGTGPGSAGYPPELGYGAHATALPPYGHSPPSSDGYPVALPHHAGGRLTTRRDSSHEYAGYGADGSGSGPPAARAPGSPASSTASYQPSYSPSQPGGPASFAPDPRRSPPQSYPATYDRSSSSPRDSASTASGSYPYAGLHPPSSVVAAPPPPPHLPLAAGGGSTPPPPPPPPHPHGKRARPRPPAAASDERRSGLSIQNLLDPALAPGRSAADNEMLDAFMPRRSK